MDDRVSGLSFSAFMCRETSVSARELGGGRKQRKREYAWYIMLCVQRREIERMTRQTNGREHSEKR